jgi:hypothetical protein
VKPKIEKSRWFKPTQLKFTIAKQVNHILSPFLKTVISSTLLNITGQNSPFLAAMALVQPALSGFYQEKSTNRKPLAYLQIYAARVTLYYV